ncbi:hypothetical protein D9758_010983 [Tetrapyrgos nigripes]|uniref:Uncharacterized protein n=1 Tax=Tetrapyrgos nigripes TaxID=182062 RepID=A0A8H5GHV5_9AGAR|nr:hypothetical protein D9758_010983 [Tetrapyrgos nigripes]
MPASSLPRCIDGENGCSRCGQLLKVKLAKNGKAPDHYFLHCIPCGFHYIFTMQSAREGYARGWRPRDISPLMHDSPSPPSQPDPPPPPPSVLPPSVFSQPSAATVTNLCTGGCSQGTRANSLCKNRDPQGPFCKNCCIARNGCAVGSHRPGKLSKRAIRRSLGAAPISVVPPPIRSLMAPAVDLPALSSSFASTSLPSLSFPSSSSSELRLSSSALSLPSCGLRLSSPTPSWLADMDRTLEQYDVEDALQEEEWSRTSDQILRELSAVDQLLDTESAASPTIPSHLPTPPIPSLSSSLPSKGKGKAKTIHLEDVWLSETPASQASGRSSKPLKRAYHSFEIIFWNKTGQEAVRRTVQPSQNWPKFSLADHSELLDELTGGEAIYVLEVYKLQMGWWSSLPVNHVFQVSPNDTLLLRRASVSIPSSELQPILAAVKSAHSQPHLRDNIAGERQAIRQELAERKKRPSMPIIIDDDDDSEVEAPDRNGQKFFPEGSYSERKSSMDGQY